MTIAKRKAKEVWFSENFDLLECLSCNQKGLKKNGEYVTKVGDHPGWYCPTCYEKLSERGKEEHKRMFNDAMQQKISSIFSRYTNV